MAISTTFLQNILENFKNLPAQVRALPQLPNALWSMSHPENFLPKEGFVFARNADGSQNVNGLIDKRLIYGDKPVNRKVAEISKKILSPQTEASPSPVTSPIAMTQVLQPSAQPVPASPISAVADVVNKGVFGRSQKAKSIKPSDIVIDAISKAIQAHPVREDLMYDIAAQESVLDPSRRARDYGFDGVTIDPSTGKAYPLSTAEGLFMFNEPTWNTILNSYNDKPGMSLHLPNTNRLDPYTSAMAAAYLIKNGQLGKWDASRDVWGPVYNKQDLLPYYSQSMDSYSSW